MPTTRIIELLAQQAPFSYGEDANGRALFACNFLGIADTLTAIEDVVIKLIVDAGLGVAGTSLFIGPIATVPDADTPIVTVTMTSGMRPDITHDANRYESLSFQVAVRARDYLVGKARANDIYLLLDDTRNVSVVTT